MWRRFQVEKGSPEAEDYVRTVAENSWRKNYLPTQRAQKKILCLCPPQYIHLGPEF